MRTSMGAGLLGLCAALQICPACAAEEPRGKVLEASAAGLPGGISGPAGKRTVTEPGPGSEKLDEIIELERAGGFVRGMGFLESGIRERAGDYGGAVIAVYKEFAWAWNYGSLSKGEVEKGIGAVLTGFAGQGEGPERAVLAAQGVLAFVRNDWAEAQKCLEAAAPGEAEPDGFSQWMLLVCALEGGGDAAAARAAYGAIRARYRLFPEYWYRGARAFSGSIAAGYAENCISLNPGSPFAAECRAVIAKTLGPGFPGEAIRSKTEIDLIINNAISSLNPELLGDLFPLISLPENAYTVYALEAMKPLAARPAFREFLENKARASSGRLAERLSYIARGQG